MKTFTVELTRVYATSIEAETEEEAREQALLMDEDYDWNYPGMETQVTFCEQNVDECIPKETK